ncbi:MAG: hypothetical protein C4526_02355 [Nitrospiraceae bacterium]|nr:MAG: hypothetical protein C4526_02355 [Nitrospiraceae bacterium]
MNIRRYFNKNKHGIWLYTVLIVASAAAALFAVNNIKISPDSMRFGVVSQQILSGNGIRVPVIRLEDNYVPVNGAIPFLDQMPLLPVLFALLGGVTPQNYVPAQLINVVCHVAVAIFTFLLMGKFCNRGIALLTGILVSFSYPLLRLTQFIASEPLFIALTTAAIYFLILSRDTDRSHFRRNLFIAGICASAAIFTRNAGIALIPVFLWEALMAAKNKRPEVNYVSTIFALALPVIATATMFVRNYIISGTFRGFSQASPERSFLQALSGTVETIYLQFQLSKSSFFLFSMIMMLCMLYVLINTRLRKEALKYLNAGFDSIIVFQISYTTLIVLTMAKQAWRFELRYMSPIVPFLFVAAIFLLVFVWERITIGRFSNLSFIGLISSLVIIAGGSLYKTYLNLPEFSYRPEKTYSILEYCTYKWIKEKYAANTVIATNKPFHLSFFGGYSTIALPHKRFDPTIHVPDDMESVLPDRMSKSGSQVIALFEEAEEKYDGDYIAGLFNERRDNDRFIVTHTCSDGVVYISRK